MISTLNIKNGNQKIWVFTKTVKLNNPVVSFILQRFMYEFSSLVCLPVASEENDRLVDILFYFSEFVFKL